MFAGKTIPAGWLLCDGSAVSRTNYAKLFSAIGTVYGAGDGSTTFALPNLVGRFVEGSATAGTYKEAGLPNIYGMIAVMVKDTSVDVSTSSALGAFAFGPANEVAGNGGGYTGYRSATLKLNANALKAIYGNSTTVQPPALTMLPIIKY